MNNPLSLVPLRMPFHNAHLLTHEQVAELDSALDFNAALAAMCPQVDGTGSAPFFIGRSFAVPNTSRVAHTLYVIAHLDPAECDTLITDYVANTLYDGTAKRDVPNAASASFIGAPEGYAVLTAIALTEGDKLVDLQHAPPYIEAENHVALTLVMGAADELLTFVAVDRAGCPSTLHMVDLLSVDESQNVLCKQTYVAPLFDK